MRIPDITISPLFLIYYSIVLQVFCELLVIYLQLSNHNFYFLEKNYLTHFDKKPYVIQMISTKIF